MRLLIVSPFYAPVCLYGGVARATQDLAGALAERGLSVKVITTRANGNADLLDSSAACEGVEVDYCPRLASSGNAFISVPLLRRCLKECKKHDAVLSVGLWTFPSFIASKVARHFAIPNLVTLHGMLMPVAVGHHRLRKLLMLKTVEGRRLSRADRVVCTSAVERSEYLRLGIGDKACIVPNIVDLRKVEPNRQAFRAQYNLSSNFVIMYAGRVLPIKGIDLTIHAFSKLASKHLDARLVIVGPSEGGYGERLKQLVTVLGLQNQVRFLGTLEGDSYWNAIAGADLFVLNSHSENFGLAAAEALGLGVPVLLSDQVGIAETVAQHQAGLVTKLDIDSIAQAIDFLAGKQEHLCEMGRRGRNLVHKRFAPSAVADLFARHLEDLVGDSATCRNQKRRIRGTAC